MGLRREVERWFLELRDPVFRYLYTSGCPPAVAEEITQEAFLRLHSGMQDGVHVKDVRAWVFRVARNLWIDQRREHQRYWTTEGHAKDRFDLGAADSAPDPERRLLHLERLRLVESEFRRLPELERECMLLKAEGLRYREIADALGIPMTTAVDRVRRAVKRMGRRLSD